ncbi:MAG TPA: hypothetical protein VL331_08645 [Croceibacterium sp.]|nr:hypothetical protein [Croceibacterium sp.]
MTIQADEARATLAQVPGVFLLGSLAARGLPAIPGRDHVAQLIEHAKAHPPSEVRSREVAAR